MQFKKKIILLVEDNPDDIELTTEALKENKITNEVIVLNNGADALDYIFSEGKYADRDPDVNVALVLLDIKLPKVNGLEVLEKIRKSEDAKYTPVVILTSSKEEQDLLNGYKLGCNSYIRKPVEFEEFVRAVKELGLYWMILNEPPLER